MPVAVILDIPGATLEQYDQVIEKMGFTKGGPGAPGGLTHWVAATDNGIRVVDTWQSREAFEAFTREKTEPFMAEVGMTEKPDITFFEVHNYLTEGLAA
jgi:hypothetical protein